MTSLSDRPVPPIRTSDSAPGPRGWAALRPLVLRVHFYAGLLVAPFLVVACLTGLAHVFSPQLNDLIYDHELRVGPHTGAPRPLDEQVAAALAAHPEGTLDSLVVDSDPDRTTAIVLAVPGLPEETARSVYVDPYTAHVRGALDTWYDTPPLQTTLDTLHRNLLLGETGRWYSKLAASWLPVLVLGGLALWIGRRRTRLLRVPARGNPAGRSRIRAWHGAGLTWSEHAGERFSALVTAVQGNSPDLAAAAVPVREEPQITVQRAVDTARGVGLAGPLKVTPPAEPGAVFTLAENAGTWPVQRDAVSVDPWTGEITEALWWADWPVMAKLTRIGILAHMGSLFGLVSQMALTAMALGLLTMIFWGYRMWWQRRPTRDARLPGALAPRGVARALSQPTAFVVILLTVAVCWLAPLLGISLLAFLALDAIAAAIGRRRARVS